MLNNTKILKKSRSLEIIQEVKSTQLLVNSTSKLHSTEATRARSSSLWNLQAKEKIEKIEPLIFLSQIEDFNSSIKKGKDIEVLIKKLELELKATNSFNISKHTFERALLHDCFYDPISEDVKNITIKFLPFSTSDKKVLCGLEEFNKVYLLTNGLKDFYITRILFDVTMTKEEFVKWELKSKLWYQDKNFRKQLFNEIQKDLEINQYSLLKDCDLKESNLEFFTNDLPKVKFKFTDFVA